MVVVVDVVVGVVTALLLLQAARPMTTPLRAMAPHRRERAIRFI